MRLMRSSHFWKATQRQAFGQVLRTSSRSSNSKAGTSERAAPRFIDIAVNLTDPLFRGVNHKGKRVHEDDFDLVLQRAQEHGVKKIIVTGTSLRTSQLAVELCRQHPGLLYCTVGCHPAESSQFEKHPEGPDAYLNGLLALVQENMDVVVAVGEMGLDYTELKYCPKDVQAKYFEKQLNLFKDVDLPMFLHSREVGMDFVEILRRHQPSLLKGGVVHSFTGSLEEMDELLGMSFHLGVTGCSLKTAQQLQVIRQAPLDRLLLETDAPWCDIRPDHAGHHWVTTTPFPSRSKEKFRRGQGVKRRHEPAHIIQVCEVLAGARDMAPVDLASAAYENTMRLFFPSMP